LRRVMHEPKISCHFRTGLYF